MHEPEGVRPAPTGRRSPWPWVGAKELVRSGEAQISFVPLAFLGPQSVESPAEQIVEAVRQERKRVLARSERSGTA